MIFPGVVATRAVVLGVAGLATGSGISIVGFEFAAGAPPPAARTSAEGEGSPLATGGRAAGEQADRIGDERAIDAD